MNFMVAWCIKWRRLLALMIFQRSNSLFVDQLYKDKSLGLHAYDLIFFTTDLQTVNYFTTIHFFN